MKMKKLGVLISASLLSTVLFADTEHKPVIDPVAPVGTVDMSKVNYLMSRSMGSIGNNNLSLDKYSYVNGFQSAIAGKD
jgi:hypothetical protein